MPTGKNNNFVKYHESTISTHSFWQLPTYLQTVGFHTFVDT